MALSVDEALTLAPGTLLTFGVNDWTFEVVEVKSHPSGVELILKRSDGYDTFAHGHTLDVANIIKRVEPTVPSVPVQPGQPTPPTSKKVSKG